MSDCLPTFNDRTVVELTDENKKAIIAKLNEAISNLACFRDFLKMGPINKTSVWTLLGLNEHFHADLSGMLNYESILAAEEAKRHIEIRDANIKIHQLEQERGKDVTPDAVYGALKLYETIFNAWYNNEGFRFADTKFSYSGLRAEFSAEMEMNDECSYPNDPVYAALWAKDAGTKQKMDSGWDIIYEPYHAELLDTDNNKERFTEMITKAFPGACINGFSCRRNDFKSFSLRPDIFIPYSDIRKLYN